MLRRLHWLRGWLLGRLFLQECFDVLNALCHLDHRVLRLFSTGAVSDKIENDQDRQEYRDDRADSHYRPKQAGVDTETTHEISRVEALRRILHMLSVYALAARIAIAGNRYFASLRNSRISPGWQSSALQIASSVEKRTAFALPFFRIEMFAMVMPTFSVSSVTLILRFASITSILITIAMIIPSSRFQIL